MSVITLEATHTTQQVQFNSTVEELDQARVTCKRVLNKPAAFIGATITVAENEYLWLMTALCLSRF